MREILITIFSYVIVFYLGGFLTYQYQSRKLHHIEQKHFKERLERYQKGYADGSASVRRKLLQGRPPKSSLNGHVDL